MAGVAGGKWGNYSQARQKGREINYLQAGTEREAREESAERERKEEDS